MLQGTIVGETTRIALQTNEHGCSLQRRCNSIKTLLFVIQDIILRSARVVFRFGILIHRDFSYFMYQEISGT